MAVSKETMKLAVEYVSLTSRAFKLAQEIEAEKKALSTELTKKVGAVSELLLKGKVIQAEESKQANAVLGTHGGALDALGNVLTEFVLKQASPKQASSLGAGSNEPLETPNGKSHPKVAQVGERVPVGQRLSDQMFQKRIMGR